MRRISVKIATAAVSLTKAVWGRKDWDLDAAWWPQIDVETGGKQHSKLKARLKGG